MLGERVKPRVTVGLAVAADGLLAVTMARATWVLGASTVAAVACGAGVVVLGLLPLRLARRHLRRSSAPPLPAP